MTTNANSVSLATKYINSAVQGLALAVASNTTLTVGAGSAIDSTNSSNIVLPLGVTINAANNGLNGLDAGTFAASTWYYVFLVGDSLGKNPSGCLISLSSTLPTLPTGYDAYRLIGMALSDGSVHFLPCNQVGNANFRRYFWDQDVVALNDGVATSLTAISLAASVPAINNTVVHLEVEYTPATANDKVSFAPFGSTATLLPHVNGSVAAKINSGQLDVLSKLDSGVPKILYINSAASGNSDVWVSGFDHFI